jgi:hypothetical protein
MRTLIFLIAFISTHSFVFAQGLDSNGLFTYTEKFGRKKIKDFAKENRTEDLIKYLEKVTIKPNTAFSYYWSNRLIPSLKQPIDCHLGLVLFRGIPPYKVVKDYLENQFSDYVEPYQQNIIYEKQSIVYYDKNIGEGNLAISSNMHSVSSANSPFISFTTNMAITQNFIDQNGKIGVYLFDPRRIIWSMNSKYSEQELLVPLFTLKRDLLGYIPYYDSKSKDKLTYVAKEVAAMVKKACPKHPYASEFKDGPPIFQNNNQYQVRFRTERDKLLKECNCKDPEPK